MTWHIIKTRARGYCVKRKKVFFFLNIMHNSFFHFLHNFQFSRSNLSQVTLMNLDFEASAGYFCEVTIDNPIFTKASKEEHIHVIGMWWINVVLYFTFVDFLHSLFYVRPLLLLLYSLSCLLHLSAYTLIEHHTHPFIERAFFVG